METNITGKLYFGHPINTYNNPLKGYHFPFEDWLMARIKGHFPDCIIENPNQEKHREGYQKWSKEKKNGMLYFFEEVLPTCDAGGIFLPFKDGRWGAGVYGEAEKLAEKGLPVWTINYRGHIEDIPSLKEIIPLSIEETRERVYYWPERMIKPYQ